MSRALGVQVRQFTARTRLLIQDWHRAERNFARRGQQDTADAFGVCAQMLCATLTGATATTGNPQPPAPCTRKPPSV